MVAIGDIVKSDVKLKLRLTARKGREFREGVRVGVNTTLSDANKKSETRWPMGAKSVIL